MLQYELRIFPMIRNCSDIHAKALKLSWLGQAGCALICLISWLWVAQVQAEDVLLHDSNADGKLSLTCFGDSVTYGLGDGNPPGADDTSFPEIKSGAGYPGRIQTLAQVLVKNEGVPGEELIDQGALRLSELLATSTDDLLLVLEGANDAFQSRSSLEYEVALQRAINVAEFSGHPLVLATLPEPCCNHARLIPFTRDFSAVVRDLAQANSIPFIDVERAWQNTCAGEAQCPLFNLPEGLHPNSLGYDALSQIVLAGLYGVDIFSSGGAAQLEEALGLSAGTVVVKPDPVQ